MLALGQSKHQAKFLSTLSLRRATSFDFCIICLPSYFYPRSPCGERQLCEGNRAAEPYFYPRSPCGERLTSVVNSAGTIDFYPRSPCGERHCTSIGRPKRLYFYPRSPCGERHSSVNTADQEARFLSTLSLRRATRLPTALRTPHQRFLSTLSLRRATR